MIKKNKSFLTTEFTEEKIKLSALRELRGFILFIFIILVSHPVFSLEGNYNSINGLIDELKLKCSYDIARNTLKLQKDGKTVLLINEMPFILLDDKKFFTGTLTSGRDGEFFLPDTDIQIVRNFFSGSDLFIEEHDKKKLQAKNGETFLNIRTADNKSGNNDSSNEEDASGDNSIKIKNNYVFSYEEDNKKKKIKINAIIVDPGHGGNDPGAIGYFGSQEKDINLKAALILKNKLQEKYPDKNIIMTRDKDVFVSLEKRSQIANYVFNKFGASLFISIHVNASRSVKSYGFETWILVEEYRRNIVKKGEITNDSDVEKVLNSMLNDEIFQESKTLAKKIQTSMEKEVGYASLNRGIKEQTYFVIKKSIMPAILVEIGFNTNKYEEIRLTKYEYLNKIGSAIFKGTVDFIDEFEKTFGFTK